MSDASEERIEKLIVLAQRLAAVDALSCKEIEEGDWKGLTRRRERAARRRFKRQLVKMESGELKEAHSRAQSVISAAVSSVETWREQDA